MVANHLGIDEIIQKCICYLLRKINFANCVDLWEFARLVAFDTSIITTNHGVFALARLVASNLRAGFKMAHPTMVEATDDRTDQYQRIIKDVLSRNKNTQMVNIKILTSSA